MWTEKKIIDYVKEKQEHKLIFQGRIPESLFMRLKKYAKDNNCSMQLLVEISVRKILEEAENGDNQS